MHVGMGVAFQNPENALSDAEVWDNEVAIAVGAEELGFDSIWSVEHHFTDYTMCPDPVQFLTYVAARTSRIQLGTGVIVLPWHDPMRVAEQITMLDNLSGGRLILGIGRGLARVEYEGFGVDMNTSRQRFTETAECILTGLEQGYLEYEGETIRQARRDLRPAPRRSFRGRTYAAAVSPESMPIMAKLGIGLLVIPQKPWAAVEEDFRVYTDVYRTANGAEAPAPLCGGFCFVDESADRAEEMAHRYIGGVLRHGAEALRVRRGAARRREGLRVLHGHHEVRGPSRQGRRRRRFREAHAVRHAGAGAREARSHQGQDRHGRLLPELRVRRYDVRRRSPQHAALRRRGDARAEVVGGAARRTRRNRRRLTPRAAKHQTRLM